PGNGCQIGRPLSSGRYRILVRPFADLPLRGSLAWTFEQIQVLSEGVGAEAWMDGGKRRFFRFSTTSQKRIGLGVQVAAERLECRLFDHRYREIGEGCQQFPLLETGNFFLAVRALEGSGPMRFRPVLVGLSAARDNVPEEYLRDFFQRIGGAP